MRKTQLARAIALTIPLAILAGCNDNDSDSNENTIPTPSNGPVITFDPAQGVVPFPSDIFGFDTDGTLRIPGASGWTNNVPTESPNAYWNYLDSKDGWGTSVPIVVNLTTPETGSAINAETLETGVKLFREGTEGNLVPLVWNEDFRAIMGKSGSLNIEPLKPFAEGTRYFIALTTGITDSRGEPIQPSKAYKTLLTGDDEMSVHLQEVTTTLANTGIPENTIVYGAAFTTTSILKIMRPVVDAFLTNYGDSTKITGLTEEPEASETPVPVNRLHNKILKKIKDAIKESNLSLSDLKPEPSSDHYTLYTATIGLPYYLDTPVSGANCEYNPYVDSLAGNAPPNLNEYRVAPQKFCPGAFSFWQTDDDGKASGTPVTGETANNIHTYKTPSENEVKLLISIPTSVERPPNGFKTFMYAHGYGSSKNEIKRIADYLAEQGYAMVALDQPMHGDRQVDVDGNGTYDLSATKRRTDFVMGNNLLTTRSFMQQTLADYVGLRMAIANGVKNSDGELLMDSENIHMVGLSLGGITTLSVTALLKDTQEQHPDLKDKLDLKTSSMSVPGGGVASVVIQSPLLAEEVKADFLNGAAFRLHMAELLDLYSPLTELDKASKVAALDKTDEYRTALEGQDLSNIDAITDPDTKEKALEVEAVFNELTSNSNASLEKFSDFEEQLWLNFVNVAERVEQSVIDPADPTNFTAILAEHKDMPLFLTEAVGDGSNTVNKEDIKAALTPWGKPLNPGDFIIVNQAQEMPLAGTDPLIRTLGLDILTGDTTINSEYPIRGAARYGYGTHMSMALGVPTDKLFKNLLPHDVDVHKSIISGIISMAESNGTSIMLPSQAESNNAPLLLDKDELPEQPAYKE